MNSSGEVIELKGQNALVKFRRTRACKNCQACMSFSSEELVVELKNTLGANVGDRVNIVLHSRSVVKAGLIAYGIPLLALIAGMFIGSIFGELFAAIGGIGATLLAFLLLRLLEPRFEWMSEFQPRMLGLIDETEDAENE